jgi:hypothetical protein
MLKLTVCALALLTALPALAQVRSQSTTTTTTQSAPAPRPAPPPAVQSEPLPPDPNAGPGEPPQTLGVLKDTVVHPGSVTTTGSSTVIDTQTLPQIGTAPATRSETTRIEIGP